MVIVRIVQARHDGCAAHVDHSGVGAVKRVVQRLDGSHAHDLAVTNG